MEQIGLQPKASLTGTGTTNNQNIFVSGIGRIFRTVAHHQSLCFCENHIVLKLWSHKRFNIFGGSPTSRTILNIVAILFCIFPSQIYCKPQTSATDNTNEQIKWVKARQRIPECNRENRKKAEEFCRTVCTLSHTPCFSDICCNQSHNDIWDIQNQELFDFSCIYHKSRSFFFSRIFLGSDATRFLNLLSCASTLGFLSLVNALA